MRSIALAMTILLAAATSASAAPLDITDIVGGWLNAVPPANATIVNAANQGTDTVRWPVPPDPNQSGYNFTPGADIIGAALNTPLLLGTFQHINQAIFSSITAVDYAFGFSTNGVPNALSDTFHFDHNETPNAPGPPASDDIVTVSSVSLNELITVGVDQFFFNLLGFSTDGGVTFSSQFSSPEGGTNTAQLYGRVTSQPVGVPEPASLLLFGCGLAVAVAARRKMSSRMRQSASEICELSS